MPPDPTIRTPNREAPQEAAAAHLQLRDVVSIIIGIVIGAGIYETAPFVFKNVSGPWMALAAWALGGLLSFIGALCYAELATTYPRSGGDYVYLTRAYGPWAGFLFGWAQLAVIMTGSIGMMAYVFANYASNLWSFGGGAACWYAAGAVAVFTLTNSLGILFGKGAQNLLTLLKVLGLAGIVAAGFGSSGADPASGTALSAGAASGGASFGMAMILVLYTYGGWNDAAFVAAEVADKKRNIPPALAMGTAALTAIYLLVNGAYLFALGFEGARESRAIAADVLARPLGEIGAKTMSVLVMVSALGAVNGLILTGSRIYASLGADFRMFGWLGRWNTRFGSPIASLLAQGAITLAMVFLVGTEGGREAINAVLDRLGIGTLSWEGHGGFDTLLRCTSPFFWLMFLMTGVSVFALRFKDQGIPRPFRVPLYPWLPLIFCGMCACMLYSSAIYAGRLLLVGGAPFVLGFGLYAVARRQSRRTESAP